MKKTFLTITFGLAVMATAVAQQIHFEEYRLDNGLNVILHKDSTAPVVITSVMYQVGSKDEQPDRTGFAHFFEHLLFEATENIERGKWFEIVTSYGGSNNANTSFDRTYYYEVFPSNAVEVGLWMESERMLHPIMDQTGVDTQNEVVKEEKRLRVDNRPYGRFLEVLVSNLFKKHPYRWMPIGEMEHLDAATLEEFIAFNEKFYIPNNATLVVAGDIDEAEVKKMIEGYFGDIPRGPEIDRNVFVEDRIPSQIDAVAYDPNIQVPAVMLAWRTPHMKTRDARVMDMISTILSQGKSSRLHKKIVDEKKMALVVQAVNFAQQDHGMYLVFGIPLNETTLEDLTAEIDEEITRLQNELISEREFEKLQNVIETRFVNQNASVEGVAGSLATYQMFHGDTDLINTEIEIYRSITREEIREAARKYLGSHQRVRLEYLPEEDSDQ